MFNFKKAKKEVRIDLPLEYQCYVIISPCCVHGNKLFRDGIQLNGIIHELHGFQIIGKGKEQKIMPGDQVKFIVSKIKKAEGSDE